MLHMRITNIPETNSKKTLEFDIVDDDPDGDGAVRIAEAIDAHVERGAPPVDLDISRRSHRDGVLLHIQDALPDVLR
jgi:hypothetical protein